MEYRKVKIHIKAIAALSSCCCCWRHSVPGKGLRNSFQEIFPGNSFQELAFLETARISQNQRGKGIKGRLCSPHVFREAQKPQEVSQSLPQHGSTMIQEVCGLKSWFLHGCLLLLC